MIRSPSFINVATARKRRIELCIVDSEVKYVRCPWCKTEIEPGAKTCPNCNRLIVINGRERLSSQSRKYTGLLNREGNVLIDHDINEDVKISNEGQDDLLYSDVLKHHSSIEVRSAGSRMGGTHHVKSVRHKIGASDESEQKTRCPNCRTENQKRDRFCKKCGTGISS